MVTRRAPMRTEAGTAINTPTTRGRERERERTSRLEESRTRGMDSSRIVPTPPAPDGQTQFSFDRFMLPLSARALFDNASVHAPPVIALLSPFETRSRTTRRWLSSRRSKPREIRSRARPTLPRARILRGDTRSYV